MSIKTGGWGAQELRFGLNHIKLDLEVFNFILLELIQKSNSLKYAISPHLCAYRELKARSQFAVFTDIKFSPKIPRDLARAN